MKQGRDRRYQIVPRRQKKQFLKKPSPTIFIILFFQFIVPAVATVNYYESLLRYLPENQICLKYTKAEMFR